MSEANPTPGPGNKRPRGGDGKFAESIDTAARDGNAARMRVEGKTYQQIADALGFADKGTAHHAVERALLAARREPAELLQRVWAARLEEMYTLVNDIAKGTHYAHSGGRLIMAPVPHGEKFEPLVDPGPNLAAFSGLLRIAERHAKLFGLDAPVKFEHLTLDAVQAQIAALEAEATDAAARAEGAP